MIYVEEIGLEYEFIPIKCPNKNAYIESFFSILEIQFLQVWYFKNMSDVFEKLVNFIEFYNTDRLNGSLDYNSPIEFKNKFNKGSYQNYQVSA
ncbi:MAG: transposase [Halobacteriovoraceae bacterium]|nr:transposase [Halobacteriovoraceae bacterium]